MTINTKKEIGVAAKAYADGQRELADKVNVLQTDVTVMKHDLSSLKETNTKIELSIDHLDEATVDLKVVMAAQRETLSNIASFLKTRGELVQTQMRQVESTARADLAETRADLMDSTKVIRDDFNNRVDQISAARDVDHRELATDLREGFKGIEKKFEEQCVKIDSLSTHRWILYGAIGFCVIALPIVAALFHIVP